MPFLDSAISWTGCLVIDTAVFFLLLYKTISIGRGVRLLDTIMRNGISPHTLFREFVELTCGISSYYILLVRRHYPSLSLKPNEKLASESCSL